MFSQTKIVFSTLFAAGLITAAHAAPQAAAPAPMPSTMNATATVAPMPTAPAAENAAMHKNDAAMPSQNEAATKGVVMMLPNHDLVIVMPGELPPPGAVPVEKMSIPAADGMATMTPAVPNIAAPTTPASPGVIPMVKVVPAAGATK